MRTGGADEFLNYGVGKGICGAVSIQMLVFAIVSVSIFGIATTSRCEIAVEEAIAAIFRQAGVAIELGKIFGGGGVGEADEVDKWNHF